MSNARALGAIGYMTKPPQIDKLRPEINKVNGLMLTETDEGRSLLRVA